MFSGFVISVAWKKGDGDWRCKQWWVS